MTTILLAEDADDLAEIVTRELHASGYEVLRAADGAAALELHRTRHPDLVVLDWMLPGLDGLAVLRALRPEAATPVLMLTARADEVDRVLGLEVGADDYLTKPFSMRELVARIRALLRRADRIREQIAADLPAGFTGRLLHGPLELDPERHAFRVDGRVVELSPNEFQVMELLMRAPGRAFSRSYLMDAVWGVDAAPGDRSVDNAMLRLRRKLGSGGDLIETVWGIGYRMRDLGRDAQA